MPRLAAVVACAFIALVLAPVSRSGAQTTDAAILGAVADSTGRPIASATVLAKNVATGLTWTVRTNDAGHYAFLQLPLGGPYRIEVRRIGFRPEIRATSELRLGSRSIVDVVLTVASVTLPSVTVDANAERGRPATLGGTLRIDAPVIRLVPALGRDFTDLASLAPASGAQASLFGQRWTTTDIRVDGMQARNMLRAGQFGAGPFTLSTEALREFEVSSTVYDVTQSRQGGGAIRAATRAGTNDWMGSAFAYYRGSVLSAATDYQGRSRSQREYGAVQWGATIGGPIVRNRAHLFVALDRQDSYDPLFTGLVLTAADEVTNGVARDSLTRLVGILATNYGLDTTRAQIGRLNRRPAATTVFSRLDLAIDERNKLTVSNDFSIWESPLSGGVDQPITLFEGRSDYHSVEQLTWARLRTTLESGVQNEVRLGLSTSRRRLTPESTAPRGFVRIQSRLADGSNGDIKVQFGGNRLAPDDSREIELQVADAVHWQRGAVLLSVGTDNSLTSLDTYIAEAQSGLFEFNSLAELADRKAARYSRTVPLAEQHPHTTQAIAELGAFGQAEWRVTPNLTWTAGMRWDATRFLTAPPNDTLVQRVLGESTHRTPSDWGTAEPRVQIVWDIGGTGRDIVRVGAGKFSTQVLYYLQHNQLLNDGHRIADISLTGAAAPTPDYTAYRANPASNPGLPSGAAVPSPYVNLVDRNFRTPTVWKASAAWQHRVTDRLSLTASAVWSETRDNYMYADRNLRTSPAFTLSNEANRPVFVPASTITAAGATQNTNALASPSLGRVLELTSTGRGRQHAYIGEMSVRLPRDARFDASYTYNRAEDNSTFGCCLARTSTTFTAIKGDPRDLSSSWAPSDLDFRHKIAVSVTAPSIVGFAVGARYVASNGRVVSAVVNGDINGDEANGNDLALVFNPDDPSTPAAVGAAMRKVLGNPNNVLRDYLRANLGRIADRNGAFMPWAGRLDARATRRIATVRGQAVEVGLDVFNLGNLLNPKWGAEYQLPLGISNQNPVVQRLPLLNVVGFDQATRRYTYTVNENFGVFKKGGAPYQLQLSARYAF